MLESYSVRKIKMLWIATNEADRWTTANVHSKIPQGHEAREIAQNLRAFAVLPTTRVQFPASTLGSSQPPATSVPGDPVPTPGLSRLAYTHGT